MISITEGTWQMTLKCNVWRRINEFYYDKDKFIRFDNGWLIRKTENLKNLKDQLTIIYQ